MVDGLDSAVGLGFEPLGLHLYVTASNDNAVSIFSRDGGTGSLTPLGLVRDGGSGVDGLAGVRAVVATASHLYAVGESEDAIARFDRDGVTGLLSFQGVARNGEGGITGLVEPRSLALAGDGLNLYVAGAGSSFYSGIQPRYLLGQSDLSSERGERSRRRRSSRGHCSGGEWRWISRLQCRHR